MHGFARVHTTGMFEKPYKFIASRRGRPACRPKCCRVQHTSPFSPVAFFFCQPPMTAKSSHQRKNKSPECYCIQGFWQGMRDSNPRKRSQSPVCYRYTNPLCRKRRYYYSGNGGFVKGYSIKNPARRESRAGYRGEVIRRGFSQAP